jgi:hypothetical protein
MQELDERIKWRVWWDQYSGGPEAWHVSRLPATVFHKKYPQKAHVLPDVRECVIPAQVTT